MRTMNLFSQMPVKTVSRIASIAIVVPAMLCGSYFGHAFSMQSLGTVQAFTYIDAQGASEWVLHIDKTYKGDTPKREVSFVSGAAAMQPDNPAAEDIQGWDGEGKPLSWRSEPDGSMTRYVAELEPPVFKGGRLCYTVRTKRQAPMGFVEHEGKRYGLYRDESGVWHDANHPGLGSHNEVTVVLPPKAEVLGVEPKPKRQSIENGRPTIQWKNLGQRFEIQWRLSAE